VAGKAHDPAHCAETVAATLSAFGRVDYLVNNVGTNPVFGPVLDADADVVRKVLDVNVVAAYTWIQQVWREWMAENGGAIVNVASIAGLRPAPGLGIYAVSKAALIHLTAQLGLEMAPKVRVNAVAPAVVKTKFAAALYVGREEEAAAGYPAGAARRAARRGRRGGVPALRRGELDHRPDPRDRTAAARWSATSPERTGPLHSVVAQRDRHTLVADVLLCFLIGNRHAPSSDRAARHVRKSCSTVVSPGGKQSKRRPGVCGTGPA
jgi:NAD(P)-dependent dehydrogenase (short-subunit alcohol dehydrogenase family)